ncbi:MAG: ribosome maturation factor RimM [Symbiobacteriaceae bacterium]|nr:ribosome maturation factor RimM [Symbiobacteriaceae bacterium]
MTLQDDLRYLRTPDAIVVGLVVGVHGLHGDLRIKPLTDSPQRFSEIKEMKAAITDDNSILLHPVKARAIRGIVVLSCKEITSIKEASKWVGAEISIHPTELPTLPEGRFFIFQIIGLRVYSEDGLYLGLVSDVLFPGANDVYVVTLSPEGAALAKHCDGRELLVPVIDEVILETNLLDGTLIVRLMEGLL